METNNLKNIRNFKLLPGIKTGNFCLPGIYRLQLISNMMKPALARIFFYPETMSPTADAAGLFFIHEPEHRQPAQPAASNQNINLILKRGVIKC